MAPSTIDLQEVLGGPQFSVEQFENHRLDTVVAVKNPEIAFGIRELFRWCWMSLTMHREWHQRPATLRALLCAVKVSAMIVVKGWYGFVVVRGDANV